MSILGAIGSTSPDWMDFHKERDSQTVCFWQPTPRDPRELKYGDRWYFFRRGSNRIDGYGTYVRWSNITVKAAWTLYKEGNGSLSINEFIYSLEGASSSDKKISEMSEIGCVELQGISYFDSPLNISDIGITPLFVPFRYIRDRDLIEEGLFGYNNNENPEQIKMRFELCDERMVKPRFLKYLHIRDSQAKFRKKLLDVYGNVCAVTGDQPSEVLDAAHIQPYINISSNHVQNGLILRADIHRLFDKGMISITDDLCIIVSRFFLSSNSEYEKYHQRPLIIKNDVVRPSREALKYHRENIYLDD